MTLEIIFALFLISFGLGLLAIYFYLQGEYNFQKILKDSLNLELNRADKIKLKEQILKFNQDLTFIDSFFKRSKEISGALKVLSQHLTDDFKVELISYEKTSNSISLTGKVGQRQELLKLKSSLEAEPLFSEVDFPPSNWVKDKDINFFIKIKLQ